MIRIDVHALPVLIATLALTSQVACSASSGASPSGSPDGGSTTVVPPASDAGGTTSLDAGGAHDAAPADAGAGPDATPDATSDASSIPTEPGWTLVWNDEFNLPDGSPVDPAKWTQETGNGGWCTNHEREYYTPGTANAVMLGGSLVITATTAGRLAAAMPVRHVRIHVGADEHVRQVRAAVRTLRGAHPESPRGQGLWPALWMLGDNIGIGRLADSAARSTSWRTSAPRRRPTTAACTVPATRAGRT